MKAETGQFTPIGQLAVGQRGETDEVFPMPRNRQMPQEEVQKMGVHFNGARTARRSGAEIQKNPKKRGGRHAPRGTSPVPEEKGGSRFKRVPEKSAKGFCTKATRRDLMKGVVSRPVLVFKQKISSADASKKRSCDIRIEPP